MYLLLKREREGGSTREGGWGGEEESDQTDSVCVCVFDCIDTHTEQLLSFISPCTGPIFPFSHFTQAALSQTG